MQKSTKISLIAALCLMAIATFSTPALAVDASFAAGTQCFAKADYKKAAAFFEQSIKNGTTDGNIYYWTAVTYQRLGNIQRAKIMYEYVVRVAPSTEIAIRSTDALKLI